MTPRRVSQPGSPAVLRLTVDGRAFEVRSSSPADPERTFVLVPGLGMTHRAYARLHARLAEFSAVHAIDVPGFGGVPSPARDLTVAGMAAALGHVLDRLEIDNPVVVGQSMGAQWAVELAAERTERVAGVAVIGPVADDRHRTLTAQALALGIDALGETPPALAMVVADYARSRKRWYLSQARHMVRYRIEERAKELQMPLLVLRGARDPIAGTAWCRRLRDAAPRASLVIVPGAPHHAQFTRPVAVASALRAFARKLP